MCFSGSGGAWIEELTKHNSLFVVFFFFRQSIFKRENKKGATFDEAGFNIEQDIPPLLHVLEPWICDTSNKSWANWGK
jgi:hypothetical protein